MHFVWLFRNTMLDIIKVVTRQGYEMTNDRLDGNALKI